METVSHVHPLAEWTYRARSMCQSFACRIFHADRYELEEGLDWLRDALPTADAQSPQHATALRELLLIAVTRAAEALHRRYHRLVSQRCAQGSALEEATAAWANIDEDSRVLLGRWARAYLASFDATHPRPPAAQAAAILRRRYSAPPDLDALAHEVNASRSTLVRGFQRMYGMSPREYLIRVCLRRFVEEARKPGSSAARSAEAAGYASYHNVYDALRQRTGFVPSEIRHLSDDDIADLVHSKLSIVAVDLQRDAAGTV
jgi:AraC-like DNA-binding protein